MPAGRTIALIPPTGGIARNFAIQNQLDGPYTCIDALNVLGIDQSVGKTGRALIATRPPVTATGFTLDVPYHACDATWDDSGIILGAAVATADGAYVGTAPGAWVLHITTAPGTDFATVAVYQQTLFMARYGGTCIQLPLASAAGAGAVITPSTGVAVPTGAGLVCAHMDRLWLGKDYILNACRTGVFTDWDTGAANGAATAWASNVAIGGAIGEPMTALVPHTEDCLIIFCRDSYYVIRGNPQESGPSRLNHNFGAIMPMATCHDGMGNLWFITRNGLYMMPAGCGSAAADISRRKLPNDLMSINPGVAGTYASLSYDTRHNMLWVFIDKADTANDQAWSFDLDSFAWFKHSFAAGPMRLGVTFKAGDSIDDSALLPINSTGVVYQFDRAGSENFDSYVLYGPFQTGPAGYEGMLQRLQAAIGTNSDDVPYQVFGGQTAEEAYDKFVAETPDFEGTWAAGLTSWDHCPLRYKYFYVMPYGEGASRWAVDNIDATITARGMSRGS